MLHSPDPDVAEIAALLGDPARAAMMYALLDGGTLSATELARRASVSASAASMHLRKLVGGGLLAVERSGRHRYHRLASRDVAHALEALGAVAKPPAVVALTQATTLDALRAARTCYDHLAGRLGVRITDSLVERHVIAGTGREYRLGRSAPRFLARLGIEIAEVRRQRRAFARQCSDWTERRAHVAGALGSALLSRFVENGWLEPMKTSRAVRVTVEGRRAFSAHFRVTV